LEALELLSFVNSDEKLRERNIKGSPWLFLDLIVVQLHFVLTLSFPLEGMDLPPQRFRHMISCTVDLVFKTGSCNELLVKSRQGS
jgi:hypothetical protein